MSEEKELACKEVGKHIGEKWNTGYPGLEAGITLECLRNRKKVSVAGTQHVVSKRGMEWELMRLERQTLQDSQFLIGKCR